jgi:hypothetical protein
VDVGAALLADGQALEVVQPGEVALDHSAEAAEPGAVLALAPGDLGADAALAKEAAVLVVVASVGGQPLGAAGGDRSAHIRHGIEEGGDQLRGVVEPPVSVQASGRPVA